MYRRIQLNRKISLSTYIYIYIYTYTHTHAHINMYICIYACMLFKSGGGGGSLLDPLGTEHSGHGTLRNRRCSGVYRAFEIVSLSVKS